jgi:hypothetical protein
MYVRSTLFRKKKNFVFVMGPLFMTKLMDGREIYQTENRWLYIIYCFVALTDVGNLFFLMNIE